MPDLADFAKRMYQPKQAQDVLDSQEEQRRFLDDLSALAIEIDDEMAEGSADD